MSDPLEERLAGAVRANVASLYRWMWRSAAHGAEVHDEEGLLCAAAALPELCVATRTEASPLSDDEVLHRARDFFAQRQIPDYLVFAEVPAERTLEALLEASGFRSDYEEYPMVLRRVRAAVAVAPPSLAIRAVATEEDVATFRDIAASVFDDYGNGDLVREAFGSLDGFRDERVRAFLGCWDGRPIATTFLLVADGVAGIYLVATVPEARGRGVADALVRHAVAEGLALGTEAAVLGATEAGMAIYRRIGFEPTGAIAREFRSPGTGAS